VAMTLRREPATRPLPAPDDDFWLHGVRVRSAVPHAAVEYILEAAERAGGRDVHFCNSYTFACAKSDPKLQRVLAASAANFADGNPVVWASRLFSQPLPGTVPGPDAMDQVLAREDAGLKHYFLGSTPATLELLVERVRHDYPHVQVVGAESPPFRPLTAEELAAQDQRLVDADADVVWVGLGTPKQDFEAARIARSVPVTAIAVGAAFDFLAGTKPRAPRWVRRFKVEAFYRLAQEPRRLWRRYVFGTLHFLRLLGRETLRRRHQPQGRPGAS
jgi:N-acetylglucosaminyldiphosphoundecaprenol N-acetyl-beta-D-mannosaminyltransferase